MKKAEETKEKSEEAEICEQIKLAYVEYQLAEHTNIDKTPEQIIADSLKQTYGNNITKVKVKNEKVTVNMNINNVKKTYKYNAKTAKAYEYIDPFNYGTKTIETLMPGDDISLGTEKFRVFYNKDGIIKAMPFYNLKLDSNPIRQATKEEAQNNQEGTSTFSTSIYWNVGDDSIVMEDNRNNIQNYILAYKTRIENICADEIEIRAVKYSEIGTESWSNTELESYTSNITDEMRNPGQLGKFWTKSGYRINKYMVLFLGRY